MRRRRRGFTLVEILIAIFIIAVGLIGVLALVTATLKTSGEIIEDSYAATTARSVYEALRSGARQRSFFIPDPTNPAKTWRGFLLIHEGVQDAGSFAPPALPTKLTDLQAQLPTLQKSDFAIFLPTLAAGTTGTVLEPRFVFPRPSGYTATGSIDPNQIQTENATGQDDSYNPPHAGFDGKMCIYDVRRVYKLSDRPTAGGSGANATDTSDQYGFAVTIQRAIAPDLVDPSTNLPIPWTDANGKIDGTLFPPGRSNDSSKPYLHLNPVDGLYQVEVMVYRNFQPFYKAKHDDANPAEQAKTHEPLVGGRFAGLIAIGQ